MALKVGGTTVVDDSRIANVTHLNLASGGRTRYYQGVLGTNPVWEVYHDGGSNCTFLFNGVAKTYLQSTGTILATGDIIAYYSDDRLKTKTGTIPDALSTVCGWQGFYYQANQTAQALGFEVKQEVGLSAQTVQKTAPEIVHPAPVDNQYLTIKYDRTVPYLVEAIKTLKQEVDTLKQEVTALKQKLEVTK